MITKSQLDAMRDNAADLRRMYVGATPHACAGDVDLLTAEVDRLTTELDAARERIARYERATDPTPANGGALPTRRSPPAITPGIDDYDPLDNGTF